MSAPAILIITNRGDHTADWLVLELRSRGTDFIRFNTEDFPAEARLNWPLRRQPELRLGDRDIDLSALSAVWFRRPVAPRLPTDLSSDRAAWVADESREVHEGLWRTLDAIWVNHPDANRLASSKIEQLYRAQKLGLDVPKTLVTNSHAEAKRFVAKRPSICKPLRIGRLVIDEKEKLFFTSLITSDVLESGPALGPEPYLFQERVSKRYDLRVTVIGKDIFAVAIHSQVFPEAETDWRRGPVSNLTHEPVELPNDVSERCLQMAIEYRLNFAAIDLALTPEGTYVFFELNPNGQWAWIEQATGLPLRARLADLLEGRSDSLRWTSSNSS